MARMSDPLGKHSLPRSFVSKKHFLVNQVSKDPCEPESHRTCVAHKEIDRRSALEREAEEPSGRRDFQRSAPKRSGTVMRNS